MTQSYFSKHQNRNGLSTDDKFNQVMSPAVGEKKVILLGLENFIGFKDTVCIELARENLQVYTKKGFEGLVQDGDISDTEESSDEEEIPDPKYMKKTHINKSLRALLIVPEIAEDPRIINDINMRNVEIRQYNEDTAALNTQAANEVKCWNDMMERRDKMIKEKKIKKQLKRKEKLKKKSY
jgi:hypothetical protein